MKRTQKRGKSSTSVGFEPKTSIIELYGSINLTRKIKLFSPSAFENKAPCRTSLCHSLPSPKEKKSICTTVPHLHPLQWYSSAKHLKIEAHMKSTLKRDTTLFATRKKKKYIKKQKKKKKEIYRYILLCQVCSCPTVQNCRIKHDNTSPLFAISIFAYIFLLREQA